MTWLLVEDDPDIRNIVAVMMQLWGEKPLALSDGNAAWTWLDGVVAGTYKGELPELALMDIRMPGHTGDQIAARIRTTDRLKNIPIILMTAFTLTDLEVQSMVERSGIDHLVKKPLPDMDDFRATLYRVRDERRKHASPPPAPASAASPKPASAPPAAGTTPKPVITPAATVAAGQKAKPEPPKLPTSNSPRTVSNGKPPEPSVPPKTPKPKP